MDRHTNLPDNAEKKTPEGDHSGFSNASHSLSQLLKDTSHQEFRQIIAQMTDKQHETSQHTPKLEIHDGSAVENKSPSEKLSTQSTSRMAESPDGKKEGKPIYVVLSDGTVVMRPTGPVEIDKK